MKCWDRHRDLISGADSKNSVLLNNVLESHPNQYPNHWERTLSLICDVCHVCGNKYASVLLMLYSSYITHPKMLSLFPLSTSSQTAPPSEGKAGPITAHLKTFQ